MPYVSATRTCDSGCGREATVVLPLHDLAFCGVHRNLYELAWAQLDSKASTGDGGYLAEQGR